MCCVIIRGLAKSQPRAPSEGQLKRDFSQAVSKGEDDHVTGGTGNRAVEGAPLRLLGGSPPSLHLEGGPERQAAPSVPGKLAPGTAASTWGSETWMGFPGGGCLPQGGGCDPSSQPGCPGCPQTQPRSIPQKTHMAHLLIQGPQLKEPSTRTRSPGIRRPWARF